MSIVNVTNGMPKQKKKMSENVLTAKGNEKTVEHNEKTVELDGKL